MKAPFVLAAILAASLTALPAPAQQAPAQASGPDYGAEITGLDREIKWEQANASEVFLFIPYTFTVRK